MTAELGDDKDLRDELGVDKGLTDELGDDKDLTADLGDDKDLKAVLIDEKDLTDELGVDKGLTDELGDDKDLTADLGDDKDLRDELGDDKGLTAELENDTDLTEPVDGTPWTKLLNGPSPMYDYKLGSTVQLRISLGLFSVLPEDLDLFISTNLRKSGHKVGFLRLRFNFQQGGVKQYSKVRWNCKLSISEEKDCFDEKYLRKDHTGVSGIYTLGSSRISEEGRSSLLTPTKCSQCWRSTTLAADTLDFHIVQEDLDSNTKPWQDIITFSFKTIPDPYCEYSNCGGGGGG